MLKKSISVILALVMILSIFSIIPTSAAEKTEDASSSTEASSNSYEADVEFVAEKAPADAEGSAEESSSDKQDNSAEVNNDADKAKVADDLADTGAEADITVTGDTENGFTYNISSKKAIVTGYNDTNVTTLDIPDTLGGYSVTSIALNAFMGYSKLVSVTIPDSVTKIESHAFWNCESLRTVKLSKALTSLGGGAFGQTAIESIEIPKSLNEANTNSWGYYNFEGERYSINDGPFAFCENLKTVTFETGTTKVAKYLFYGSVGLEEIIIPDTVKTIEDNAFADCLRLNSFTIGNSVTTIGSSAFYRCLSLESIEIPISVKTISSSSFSNCLNLTSIAIPDSVTKIESHAFWNCESLRTVKLSKALTSLGGGAFGQTAIESIEIPKSLNEANTNSWEYYNFEGESYSINNGPFAFCENLKTVTFETGTTKVAKYLFYGSVGLEEIIIPDTVKTIEDNAFADCLRLNSVTIGNSVTTIGSSAFYRCLSLESIEIPISVKTISSSSFSNCLNLTSIAIPDSVTKIESHAFWNCESLRTVKLSKALTSLGGGAFGQTAIESIEIPKSLNEANTNSWEYYNFEGESYSINNGPFAFCENLKTVTFETGTTKVAKYLFYGSVGLEEIIIPDTVKTIEDNAFADCLRLNSVTIGNSVTTIGSSAFYRCLSLESIEIPISVKTISSSSFSNCLNLTSIAIPDSVTKIESHAFWNCESLRTVKLSKALTSLGGGAFGQTAIESIEIPKSLNEANTNSWEYYNFEGESYSINNGPFAFCENLKTVTFETGTTKVAKYLFYGSVGLEEIIIPDTVKTIEDNAFADCLRLNSVTIGNSVTTIGSSAFYRCLSLESIEIPISVKTISSSSFSNCLNLTSIAIPDSVTKIESHAFWNCESLRTVKLSKALTSLGGGAFGQTAIESIEIPKSLNEANTNSWEYYNFEGESYSINNGPFAFCENLKTVTFETGTTKVAKYLFYGSVGLEEIIIPDTVKTIEDNAFADCLRLNSVTIGNSVTTIGSSAFYRCLSLESIEIPISVKTISSSSFSNCLNLTSIAIPDSVTKIESHAFWNCESLRTVKLSKALTSLGGGAFGQTAIESIEIPKSLNEANTNSWGYYNFEGERYSINDGPFAFCENLKTVSFETGTTKVAKCLFEGCTGLEEIVIPNSINRIEDYAFKSCLRLKKATIGSGVKETGFEAFNRCNSELEVYCPKYSPATIIFIDNGYGSISTNDNRLTDTVVLDESASNFSIVSGAKLNVTCNYKIKDDVYKKASNYSVKIHIPSGASVEDGSLYLDKELLTKYTEQNDYISIPVTKQSGKITFNLETDGDCKLRTYAILNYSLNSKNSYDIIDVINEDIDLISLSAEDVVSSAKVKVSGVAPVNSDVDIYVNDEKAAALTANKAGVYTGEIALTDPVSDTDYAIKAVSKDNNGKEIIAEKSVQYVENAPELTDFTMKYNGGTYDLMSGKKNSITFVPGDRPFTFEAKYEHPENVDSVYITSTRNQVTKAVKADWNESKQAYVFTGVFDDNNHSYVPGAISVSYTPVKPEFTFEKAKDTDYADPKFIDGTKNPIFTGLAGNVEEALEDFYSDDKKFSGIAKLSKLDTYLDFDFVSDVIPTFLDPKNASNFGYKPVEDDTGVQIFMKVAENIDDKLEGEIVDFVSGKATSFIVKISSVSESTINSFSALSESLGYMDKLIKWDNKNTDINELKNKIMSSDMSAEERANALDKLDIAKKANNGAVAVMALNIVIAAAGIAIPFPASLVLPMIALNNEHLLDEALGSFDYLNNGYVKSGIAKFNWSIDPSGYIFSGVTSNRVGNAKVTAYWIPFDEDKDDDSFWSAPDESRAELWDSGEYSQINPLFTDNDGNYAWDVPEGWWQVKVEKDGYETYTSEWLPVPPPQTDINVNLISTEAPTLDGAEYADGAITLTFSQYMDPATMNNIVVKDYSGKSIAYTLTYSQDEKDIDGKVFAKEYQLVLDDSYEFKYEYFVVSIADAESYTGKSVTDEKEIGEKPETYLLGDVDGSGEVDTLDATYIQRRATRISVPFSDEQLIKGDVDGDGELTVLDATYIQRFATRASVPFPVGEPVA